MSNSTTTGLRARTEATQDNEDENWSKNLVLVATRNGFAPDPEKYDAYSVHKELDDVTKQSYRRELRVWDA